MTTFTSSLPNELLKLIEQKAKELGMLKTS